MVGPARLGPAGHWQVVVGEVACLVEVARGTAAVTAVYD